MIVASDYIWSLKQPRTWAAVAAMSVLAWYLELPGWAALLLCLYTPSYLDRSEYRDGRYWPLVADNRVWRWFARAWGCHVHFEVELDRSKRYIFASHPHGVISGHHGINMLTSGAGFYKYSPMDTRRDAGASIVFWLPGWRDFLLWLGCVEADKKTLVKQIMKGRSLGILVGGMDEQVMSRCGRQEIVIAKRKGFVKIAIEHGLPIVPCYCFGETELVTQSRVLFKLRWWVLKNLRIPMMAVLPWVHHVPLHQYVGEPISVKQSNHPTGAEVDRVHAEYVKALTALFERNKKKCGFADAKLKIY